MRARAANAAVLMSGALLVAGSVWLLEPRLLGPNFHGVLPGLVFRSGQLTSAELVQVLQRQGIKTIVNLRGQKPGADWYDRERALARQYGVLHYDVELSARRLPPQPAVARLVELLEHAPKPLLLHCGAGADRAGFASAVTRLVAGVPVGTARTELAFTFGHVPFGPAREIGRFFDVYQAALEATGRPDTAESFRTWVRTEYVPYVYRARLELLVFPERAPAGQRMDVRIRAVNTSPGPWRLSPSRLEGIKLGVRVRRDEDPTWRDFDRAGYLRGTIAPGAALEVSPPMLAPSDRGRYWLKLDMVDEHVTWFEDQGSRPLVLPLEVY